MKHLFAALLLLFTYACAGAQTLSGTVYDTNTKQTIPGAIVYIPELNISTVTDTGGRYKLVHVPKHTFIVEVTLLGYKTITQSINFAQTTHINFALKQSATLGNEVIITGISQATKQRLSPIPTTTVSHLYLQQNLYSNAMAALQKVPGVSTVTTGPNVSKPFIRGLGYNRVLTVYDGLRQEGQQWGSEHGIEVDQYNIDHIEIIKGPASLMYGSDALAGVVNIFPTLPAPYGKIVGSFLNEYQTNNGMVGNSLMLSGNNKGLTWLVRGSHKMAKDYRNKYDGWNYNTAFRETDLTASAGFNKEWGFSHLNFTLFDDLQEIPDGSRDSATGLFTKQITEADTVRQIVPEDELNTYKISPLHQRVQLYRLYDNSEFLFNNGSKIEATLGYEGSIRREFSHPTAPDVAGLYLTLNTYDYSVRFHFPGIKGWKPVIGIDGMYQLNNSSKSTEAVIPSYNLFDFGGFAFVKKTIQRFELSGGVRYDVRSFNNSAMYTKINPSTGFDTFVTGTDTAGAERPFYSYKTTFSGFTGSLGLSYSASDKLVFKANIARGYRAPNIAEISANGIHPGTGFYQLGNLNFKPEFSLQEDIGVEYTSDKAEATFDLFNNDISNYIYDEQLLNTKGADSVIVPGYTTFKFVASHADLYGGELSLDLHLTRWLHFENAASLVYAVNKGNGIQPVTDSTRYLPFIPPFHIVSDLRATLNKVSKHFVHLFAKAGIVYYATQNRVFSAYGTETPTAGYILFNAGIGTDITNKTGKTICTLSVMGNNLLDADYQDHLSRLKYFGYNYVTHRTGMFNMGRNIGIKLVVPLNIKIGKMDKPHNV